MPLTPPTTPGDDDAVVDAFTSWATERGLTLYDHQEEALLELVTGSHVIASTPTGSGKSLIAVAAHFSALAGGKRSYYTAPIKALVSEKFFDLIEIFGADQVGMMTGDSAINTDAPIICCTAEVLANQVLREGELHDAGVVICDEFHFYADPQRGWAWQIPLLELPNTQFVLLSATLGDVSFFAEDLQRRTGAPVAVITNTERPVPLTFEYSTEPLQDLVLKLVQTDQAPVYVVHFTQAAALAQAQALTSVKLADKAHQQRIADAIGSFSFAKGFGATLSRLLRKGIGVHHAGMLPRYRRLVERLTQAGLLAVICGTDTLGVGINVPIRTVLLTGLTKYDGVSSRHLSAREFHQIAGRAGRAGYDTHGLVIVQAPEHVIENAKSLAKAGDDERKRRKIVRKQAPSGVVNWTDKTFERLRDAQPEALTSQFSVSHAMVLGVLSRYGDPVTAMVKLLTDNHEPEREANPHLRSATRIYRSLRAADIIERLPEPDAQGRRVRLTREVPLDFALNAPLSPFALAALELLDPESETYALDVISVIEATIDDPRPVLMAQQKQARDEAIGSMKAEGWEYNDRMEALEEITHPQPLAELLFAALAEYRTAHPWVDDYRLSPKSVVRHMIEHAMTFSDLISAFTIARSEGVVLRYLSNTYQALRQVVPEAARTPELTEMIEWLGAAIRGVDSSLLAEWEALHSPGAEPQRPAQDAAPVIEARFGGEDAPLSANRHAVATAIRTAMFHRVELLARENYQALADLTPAPAHGAWDAQTWADSVDGYWREYSDIGIGPDARGRDLITIDMNADPIAVTQILDDPEGDGDWRITATVDSGASDQAEAPVISIIRVGPAGDAL